MFVWCISVKGTSLFYMVICFSSWKLYGRRALEPCWVQYVHKNEQLCISFVFHHPNFIYKFTTSVRDGARVRHRRPTRPGLALPVHHRRPTGPGPALLDSRISTDLYKFTTSVRDRARVRHKRPNGPGLALPVHHRRPTGPGSALPDSHISTDRARCARCRAGSVTEGRSGPARHPPRLWRSPA